VFPSEETYSGRRQGGRKEEERREDDLANLLQCLKKYSIVVSRDLVAEIRLTSNAITKTFSRDNCFSRKESASCASASRKYFKLRPKIWSMFSCEDREGGGWGGAKGRERGLGWNLCEVTFPTHKISHHLQNRIVSKVFDRNSSRLRFYHF
jgi:hypothetical protein